MGLKLDQHLKLVKVRIPDTMRMILREDILGEREDPLDKKGGHPG